MFINVEGLEGAAKSTSIATIQEVFKEKNHPLVVSIEPGGTPLADRCRALTKEHWDEKIDHVTELLLMFSSRNQSYNNIVIPSLKKGKSVCLDRSWWSSYAYQVHNKGNVDALFQKLLSATVRETPFTASLFLDVTPEVGLKRAGTRGKLDRIEQNKIDFFYRAREGFYYLCKTEKNTSIINADEDTDIVQANVRKWAQNLFN